MKNFILGLLIGIIGVLLCLNIIPWTSFFTLNVLKAIFAIFLALLGGLVALFQVKANVISAARIKWVEEFKKNVAEYISSTNRMVFNYKEYENSKNEEVRRNYYNNYTDELKKVQILTYQIEMNLNLSEPLHMEIYKTISKIDKLTLFNNLSKIGELENYPQLNKEFSNLSNLTRDAMKLEWDKSKKLIHFSSLKSKTD